MTALIFIFLFAVFTIASVEFRRIENGATRTVFIFRTFVIKIPLLVSLKTFANGIIGNLTEIEFGRAKKGIRYSQYLMPVLWGSCGFWVIMPRGDSIHVLDYQAFLEPRFFEVIDGETRPFSECRDPDTGNILPVENKRSSWKRYNGRYTAVDYGSGFRGNI